MNKKLKRSVAKMISLLLILAVLTGCNNNDIDKNSSNIDNSVNSGTITVPDENSSQPSENSIISDNNQADSSNTADANENNSGSIDSIASAYEKIAVDFKRKDTNADYDVSKCTLIELSDTSAAISGDNASTLIVNTADTQKQTTTAPAVQVVITSGGDYLISGECKDGQIIIATDTSEDVRLILSNAIINCENSAPILEQSCDKLIITLASDSTNCLSDKMPARISINEKDNKDEASDTSKETVPDSTIYAKDTISINGTGTLNITSDNNQGIHSKDDVKLVSGNISISSGSHGIKGKDSVVVDNANITITSKGDGIKSTGTDNDKGYVVIQGGTTTINSVQDGISTSGKLELTGGDLNITTGTGTNDSSESSKGLKADGSIFINGPVLNITSTDDSIHSNTDFLMINGQLALSSSDDGIHADSSITIEDGSIRINKSYEGIESEVIYINGGDIRVYSNDDGINASSPHAEGTFGGHMFGGMGASSNATLHINGGNIYVNAGGDGLDSNGTMYITGGVTLVDGPTNNGNSAIDHDGEAFVNGGVIVGSGSSGMIELFSTESTQNVLMVYFNKTLDANTEIKIMNGSEQILAFTNGKASQCAMISTPKLVTGETYTVTANGEEICSLTIESTITSNGSPAGFGGFGGGGFGGKGDRGEKPDRGDRGNKDNHIFDMPTN